MGDGRWMHEWKVVQLTVLINLWAYVSAESFKLWTISEN